VKENTITRELVEDNTPVWIDYQGRIEECRQRLADTDYAIIKIAEGAATREEYAEIIAERAVLRERINALLIEESKAFTQYNNSIPRAVNKTTDDGYAVSGG
jgi:hypothetical protein